jgi:uncharacterized protein (DUF362 family)
MAPTPRKKGLVVEMTNLKMLNEQQLNPDSIKDTLYKALLTLTEKEDITSALLDIFINYKQGEVIGLKVNALSKNLFSSPEFIKAFCEIILEADLGVTPSNIWVWDMRDDQLESAGITKLENSLGIKCKGTTGTNQSPGYEETPTTLFDRNTYLSKILTKEVAHLVNLTVPKTHNVSGISGCMKNNYGMIKNPWDFHTCSELYIPFLCTLPVIQQKTRLFGVEAIKGIHSGDAHSHYDCTPCKILLSFDPLAIDVQLNAILTKERGKEEPREQYRKRRESLFINAASYNLGSLEVKVIP